MYIDPNILKDKLCLKYPKENGLPLLPANVPTSRSDPRGWGPGGQCPPKPKDFTCLFGCGYEKFHFTFINGPPPKLQCWIRPWPTSTYKLTNLKTYHYF